MFKRITAFLLIFLLVLGNTAYAGGNIPIKELNQLKPTLTNLENIMGSDLDATDPNKEVRVVIEMTGEAAIDVATKRGVRYENLPENIQKQLTNEAIRVQEKVMNRIQSLKVDAEFLHQFTTVMNGFSAKVKYGDLAKIKSIAGVKEVYFTNEYFLPEEDTPDMNYSKDLIQAQQVWRDYGFTGEGMVVGIIDSGIDPEHKDFLLTDSSKAKITEDLVNSLDLPGIYFNEKVPYGYNYMDHDHGIKDLNPVTNAHGQHVAGTVAANGDQENGGIKGVAPEAQLLALRVFGHDTGSTYSDIYIAAIDDAIQLGADVLNMSLGSHTGFVVEEDPAQIAIKRATDNGIIVSISAGNSDKFGRGVFYPFTSNPDYGLVGSPSVSYHSLSVAGFENTFIDVDALRLVIGDEEGDDVMFLSAGQNEPEVGTGFELVYAGIGSPADFEGKDMEGKYALIVRGDLPFTDKALNAQAAGAAGAIIYNNAEGTVNMASDPAIVIPQLFMLKADGDRAAAALQDGTPVSVYFDGEQMSIPNVNAGLMYNSTSWGITPNLDFKPEITTPGAQIYSTINDDKYAVKSGTSMAAPHASGGAALVFEHVDSLLGLDGFERSTFAKKLMMNTAKPVEYEDGTIVSPRQQGAGLMQLHNALKTPAIMTNSETGEPKVALKEITSNQVSFELTVENFSEEDVTYEVSANAQTDAPVNAGGGLFVSYPELAGALELTGAATVSDNTIVVPAGGQVSFTVSLDVSAWDSAVRSYFTNGYWLEGFVKLTDPTDVNPDLVVPYVGFKGEWDAAPIFDAPIWEGGLKSFYEESGILTHVGGGSYNYLGVDQATGKINPNLIAFSPNGDGVKDNANMLVAFLRNARYVDFNVLDADGNVVRTIQSYEYMRKTPYDNGQAAKYWLSQETIWDGTINGEIAPEGQYYLQADGVIDFEGANHSTLEMPVKLDVTAPVVNATLGDDNRTITVDITDNLSGLAIWAVFVDGALVAQYNYTATQHVLSAPLADGQELVIVALDNAGNEGSLVLEDKGGAEELSITVISPADGSSVKSKVVVFEGYVEGPAEVVSVVVNNTAAEVTYNEDEDRYYYYLELTHSRNGLQPYRITAIDADGNEEVVYGSYMYEGMGTITPPRPIPTLPGR